MRSSIDENTNQNKPYQSQIKQYPNQMKYSNQVQGGEPQSNMSNAPPPNVESDKRPLANIPQQVCFHLYSNLFVSASIESTFSFKFSRNLVHHNPI